MNSAQYADSTPCGTCLQVTATGTGSGANPITGTFLAIVTDECPSCGSGSLDLATGGDGAWGISWVAVDCPVGTIALSYVFQGSNSWYLKVQVQNAMQPVEIFQGLIGGTWTAFTRTSDNFFTYQASTAISFPLQVELTNIFGQTVTDSISSISSTPIPGTKNVQFPSSASSRSNANAAPSSSPSGFFANTTAVAVVFSIVGVVVVAAIIIVVIFIYKRRNNQQDEDTPYKPL